MLSSQIISIIILIVCIVLFITEWIPTTLTCVLACMMFVLTNICTFSEAFSGFSNSIVILVFGMMVIGDAMFSSGLSQDIAAKVIKIAGNSERKFIFIAGLCSVFLSMFLSNTAVIAMFLAIMNSVARTNKNFKLKNICIATTMGAMFGGTCTLVGSTPQLTAQSILEKTAGESFKMWDFLPVGIILAAIYLAYVLMIGYPLGKKIWGNDLENIDLLPTELMDISPVSEGGIFKNKQKILMCLILVLMLVLFITECVTNAMTACICAALCVLAGCTNEKSVLKNINWGVLIRLAGCLGIAVGIDKGGCSELIASAFTSIFGDGVNPVLLLAGAVLLTLITSNFISNSTAVFVVLPPVLAICKSYGLNPVSYALGISYAANLCFATPLANAQTSMTMVAGYRFKDYIKYNLLLELLVFIGIVVFLPIFFRLA